MFLSNHPQSQRGIALVTALLLLLLLLSLSLGFTLMVTSEQRSNGVDLDHTQAFYAAYGAMEQLNAQLGNLFASYYAPQGSDINNLLATPPSIPGVKFYDPNNGANGFSGYEISFPPDANGNPQATAGSITQGPYAGFKGLITDYKIIVNAQSQNFSLTSGNVGTNQYGSEVRLVRTLQTVAIPVFQFGIFSQTDLSFFPGPPFSFGGVVATNGDLYLASNSTLTISSQASAYGDIIRDRLSNGYTGAGYASNYGGAVSVTTSPGSGTFRNLASTEGSINGGPSGGCPITGTGTPNTNWTTISISNYNSNLRDGAFGCSRGTGAKYLQLPLVTSGASGIDLIKLAPPSEDTNNKPVYEQRYFTYPTGTNYAMLRILIADTKNEITTLPSVSTAPAPVALAGVPAAPPPGNGDANLLPPWAQSQGSTTSGDWFKNPQSRLGMGDTNGQGPYIKIEYRDGTSAGNWSDVTAQILSLGTTGRNLSNGTVNTVGATPANLVSQSGATCYEPYPNAVIRLQRVIDVPSTLAPCGYTNAKPPLNSPGVTAISAAAGDFIPNMLFDTREALLRDNAPAFTLPCSPTTCLVLGGVMYYVELDVTNLGRWFTGAIGTKGPPPANVTGFLVYFSDRRGNQPCTPLANCPSSPSATGSRKLGNLGWEDFVNPTTGTPNNSLDTGEDLLGANLTAPGQPPVTMPLDTYGGVPGYAVATGFPYAPAAAPAGPVVRINGSTPVGSNVIAPGTGTTSPLTGTNLQTVVTINEARVNPALFFRRALKLTNASAYTLGNCGVGTPCGLTITSENPVYVEGNYNTTGGTCSGSPIVCTYNGNEAPSAILADAVTMLSSNWNDIESYNHPYATGGAGGRQAVTTFYRTAILAGKGLSFPIVGGRQDFGTDGGVHNFLRYIEKWNATPTTTLAYNGSLVSFFFNEQAVGTFKCCNTVYDPPGRGYNFDTKFLTPALLPPRTPTFRDINTLGFTQLILPNQFY